MTTSRARLRPASSPWVRPARCKPISCPTRPSCCTGAALYDGVSHRYALDAAGRTRSRSPRRSSGPAGPPASHRASDRPGRSTRPIARPWRKRCITATRGAVRRDGQPPACSQWRRTAACRCAAAFCMSDTIIEGEWDGRFDCSTAGRTPARVDVAALTPSRSYSRARLANFVYCSRNASRDAPTGPLRCLATMISAMPRCSDSGL